MFIDNLSFAHTVWNYKYHIVFAPKYRRIRKLFTFYYGKAKFDYWIAPSDLNDETMPEVDAKTFKAKVLKSINESLKIEHQKKFLSSLSVTLKMQTKRG